MAEFVIAPDAKAALCTNALDLCINVYGERNITTGHAILSLARAYSNKGDYDNAIETFHRAIDIFEAKPLRGSAYREIPDLSNANCGFINIRNEDDECFKLCMKVSPVRQSKKPIVRRH